MTKDDGTRLLHVIYNGQLIIGFEATLVLWDQMPRYRWMARIGRLPLLNPVLDWGYKHIFARVIYERHKRRQARGLVVVE